MIKKISEHLCSVPEKWMMVQQQEESTRLDQKTKKAEMIWAPRTGLASEGKPVFFSLSFQHDFFFTL